jgi:hypothetical protein
MTDFEKQVAEVLAALYEEWLKEHRGGIAMLPWAAPRVAAAIDRLARMYVDDVGGATDESTEYHLALAACRAAALAALRAET